MNCPDAFTALAKRQAFQREQACERASKRAALESHRRGERALARSVGRWKAQGDTNVVVVQTRGRGREGGGQEQPSRERGEKRVSHLVLFLSAQRDERYEGARGGFCFMISGRHYYGGHDGVAASPILFLFSRWNLWDFPEYFTKERES